MNIIFFVVFPPHLPLLYCQSYYLIGANVSVYIPADRAMCRLSSRNTYLCHGPSELQWLRGHISVLNILCVSGYTEGDCCCCLYCYYFGSYCYSCCCCFLFSFRRDAILPLVFFSFLYIFHAKFYILTRSSFVEARHLTISRGIISRGPDYKSVYLCCPTSS